MGMVPPKLPLVSSYGAPLEKHLVPCDSPNNEEKAPRRKPIPRRPGARFTVQLCSSNCVDGHSLGSSQWDWHFGFCPGPTQVLHRQHLSFEGALGDRLVWQIQDGRKRAEADRGRSQWTGQPSTELFGCGTLSCVIWCLKFQPFGSRALRSPSCSSCRRGVVAACREDRFYARMDPPTQRGHTSHRTAGLP